MCSFLMLVLLSMCVSMFEDSQEDGCGDIFPGKLKLFGSDWNAEMESHLDTSVVLLRWLFFLSLFFKWVCHTFFISLSVRPGNLAAMADHLKKMKEN